MRHGERTSVHARVWRLLPSDTTSVVGDEWQALPEPEEAPAIPFTGRWGGGFIASLDGGQFADVRPGFARSWIRSPFPLVDGEDDPATAAFVKLVDTANGLAVRESEDDVLPDVDLTIHLTRVPNQARSARPVMSRPPGSARPRASSAMSRGRSAPRHSR